MAMNWMYANPMMTEAVAAYGYSFAYRRPGSREKRS